MIRQRIFEEIYQSMRNNINDRAPQVDSKPGTFVSDVFVCPPADELTALYADLKLMEFNQSVLTASSDALDRLCANYFTFRVGATKAFGRVRFYITGTNRPTLELKNLPSEVYVPVGLTVGTTESTNTEQVTFTTLESAYATGLQILNSLPVDVSTGYKYLEVEVEAVAVGENGNVDVGAINKIVSTSVPGVAGVGNPAATAGGSDKENDTSLRMRTMLAVLGASICTKNGYLKFVIQRDYVEDAVVIGGGDSIMFRDGGFLDAAEVYRYGRGGMVDVWVRGKQVNEVTKNFAVTTAYMEDGAPDIVLDYQPVLRITSITSVASGYVYENADDYDIEYGVSSTGTTYRYYKDILWDFSVTDSFPDVNLYGVDVIDATELELMKKRVDEALTDAVDYMTNIDYTINWALVTYEDVSGYAQVPVFRKVYYNGKVYKVIAVDSRLNGRTFVKRNNRIYLRWYHNPDYVLLKDVYSDERYTSYVGADVGNSVLASDAVHWLNKNVLQEGDSLRIVYSYNLLITTLQQEFNGMRILTADILVRQAYAVKVQVIMTVYCDDSTTTTACRNTIATKISRFITNMKTMGDVLEESELAAIARQTYGVIQVDLESVQLAEKNKIAVSKIKLNANQYFELESVDVTAIAQYTLG